MAVGGAVLRGICGGMEVAGRGWWGGFNGVGEGATWTAGGRGYPPPPCFHFFIVNLFEMSKMKVKACFHTVHSKGVMVKIFIQ